MKNKSRVELKQSIPHNVISGVRQIENALSRGEFKKDRKIAAFDLDNTLLVGDIGEAFFVQLKLDEQQKPLRVDEKKIPFRWSDYQNLLAENKKKEAYSQQVAALEAIPATVITETVARVMHSPQRFLEAEGATVPVPRPNRAMQALVAYLEQLDFEIFVVSASQELAVRYVAKEFFNIPEERVIGMRNVIGEGLLTSELVEPLTVDNGKAEAYRKYIGAEAPLITAGDSTTDLPILNLTDPNGLVLWVGGSEETRRWLEKNVLYPEIVRFIS